jgi:hypothetical protein
MNLEELRQAKTVPIRRSTDPKREKPGVRAVRVPHILPESGSGLRQHWMNSVPVDTKEVRVR